MAWASKELFCYANFVKEPPEMFRGKIRKILAIFLGSARTNGSIIAKRKV